MKTTRLVLLCAFYLSQAHAYDLPKQAIKAYDCSNCEQLSHETLEDNWNISNKYLSDKTSNAQRNYGYKQQITMAQLQDGVSIHTQAPGAIVRISPVESASVPKLQFKTPANKTMSIEELSSLHSDKATMGELAQTMLQLKPELGAGTFIIKSNDAQFKKTDHFMINVYDKYSSNYIEVATDSVNYHYGDTMTALITLTDSTTEYTVEDISAALYGPKQQKIALTITQIGDNQFTASAPLKSETSDEGENWYVEVTAQTFYGPKTVRHTGHTAFSYAIPSANILSIKKTASKPLTFEATVNVATASRYSLQTVLFSENEKGRPRPFETCHKSQWLEPGKQKIQFTFDNSKQLADDSLYLGYLRLIDYGQLKPVYQYNQPVKLTQLVD